MVPADRHVCIFRFVKFFRVFAVVSVALGLVASQATGFSAGEPQVHNGLPAERPPQASGNAVPERLPAVTAGEAEMNALAASYPTVISEVMFREGDWALRIGEVWYYWADGRLLPGDLRAQADQYVGIRFYNYELGPVEKLADVPPEIEPSLRARTRAVTSDTDERLRFNAFLDTLYGVGSLAEAERTMESVQFLGKWIRVHPFMVAPLERVEARIRDAMTTDQRVTSYVSSLSSIHAYNWRNIAGTLRRSYHSYGVAVDLVPASYGGKWAYWLWAAESGVDEWWKLNMNERLAVPQPVVDAFESEGFIWGGKWLFFDNLHFEYRPESIRLARGLADG